ncbi:MAG: chlorite dismutase [Planctomycetes bacterium]|nr:chlorite dismutase [Planctomycetota bacterium]
MTPIASTFVAGPDGVWRIEVVEPVTGASLPAAPRLSVLAGHVVQPASALWAVRGSTGHQRYTRRDEAAALRAVQAGLDRPAATWASLIPIQKSAAWWELAQDERRAIFEETSHHIGASLRFLPAIARRLYHGRELGEPFDFLTWFEYAPEHAAAFDELLAVLRASEEWLFVTREVHVRLARQ